MDEYLLEMEHISKSFSGVPALTDVSFNLKPGEVHVLIGENGAGKSTLMNILCGLFRADSGTIKISGETVEIPNQAAAMSLGIAIVHQELSNVPDMTIAENIFLGREPHKSGVLLKKDMNSSAKALLSKMGMNFDTSAKMRSLNVSNQQIIEIAKAISMDAKIIVLDEPTSAITDDEVERLFSIISELKKHNVGIIYISHRMEEIFRIGDRITVLRDGSRIDTRSTSEYSEESLVAQMVGRSITDIFPKYNGEVGETVFEVKNVSVKGWCNNISFKVRKGEILGFSGLMGAGRTELMEGIFGIRAISSGEIYLDDVKIRIDSPKRAISYGLAYLSEDRQLKGLNPKASVGDNITIASLQKFARAGMINGHREQHAIDEYIEKLRIKTSSPRQKICNLSGGNAQKAIIARWMLTNPRVFILDEPTRGIDIGAKAEIHGLISKMAADGIAVIIVSSELPEVMGMSDRILVMHEGSITGELLRGDFSQEKIMQYATVFNGG
jgi:ABC-type sugar transport system ATPase subunit